MAVNLENLNLLTAWNEIDRNFPSITRELAVYIDSTAFMNLTGAVVKNAPYCLSDTFIVSYAISSRLRFVETLVISVATAVYNYAFALLFSVGAIVTLGQSKTLNFEAKKFWIHTALSTASAGISAMGVVSLNAANLFTGLLWTALAARVWVVLQRDGENFVHNFMNRYADPIARVALGNDENRDERAPVLANRLRQMQNVDDLQGLWNGLLNGLGNAGAAEHVDRAVQAEISDEHVVQERPANFADNHQGNDETVEEEPVNCGVQ